MSVWKDDPFEVLVVDQETDADAFSELSRRSVAATDRSIVPSAATARFHGFDLDDRPLVVGLPGLPHEIVGARTTIALLHRHVGSDVVVVFEQADVRRPIIVGVLQNPGVALQPAPVPEPLVSAQVDDQRVVLTAEREIVLKCGEASITLTRAGKVIIKGAYILSRSSGYNKIKGAAVDIN
jgi:Domain of unknown function (DUF6484)